MMLQNRWGCVVLVGIFAILLLSGCDLLDEILGQDGGGSGAPTAVIRAEVSDDLVNAGMNPDHRPPLRYQFFASDSRDSHGVLVTASAEHFDYSWDFGNGITLDPGGYATPPRIFYMEEGVYDVTLTVTEWGGGTDTVTERITIGEPWLSIMALDWTERSDGQRDVTIGVVNQSSQPLKTFIVRLAVNGVHLRDVGVDLTGQVPERLLPDGGYLMTAILSPWVGELTATSHFCTPWE